MNMEKKLYLRKLGPVVPSSVQPGLNSWPFYTVLRLVVCLVLFSYIKRSKAGDCVQSQLANFSRIKEPRPADSPRNRQILQAWSVSYLFP